MFSLMLITNKVHSDHAVVEPQSPGPVDSFNIFQISVYLFVGFSPVPLYCNFGSVNLPQNFPLYPQDFLYSWKADWKASL